VTDVLIYADSIRSPEMRHEVAAAVPDPFLYAERDGRRSTMVWSMELPRLQGLPGLEARPFEEFGLDGLVARGVHREELYLHLVENVCRDLELRSVTVPPAFPTALADHLRAAGIEIHPDRAFFAARRRVKTEPELAGIRRAQRAAEAAMDVIREHLREADASNSTLVLEGKPLTCERLKRAAGDVFIAHDVVVDELIVSHGAQSAIGHEMGSGPIAPGEPIVVDLWPRDRETACYADMTRTFVVGEPPAELVEYHRLCLQALQEALAAVRPGAIGREVFVGTCELFQKAGYPTQLTKAPGEVLDEGFFHGLGHGVGLEVHEEPNLGIAGLDELVAGDVITVEPGLYRPGFGGCRLEDLVLVTENGAENLTDYSYGLTP
jgi:Xaa-Pro aminopeptidase